ncbi:MAG: hypothetical protein NC911_01350 [Candidatus Omnitrophica bacterium]|nr:hypothetical protein [Candidatus Omnitrophota bacterium]
MSNKITVGFVGFGEVNTPRRLIEEKSAETIKAIESLGLAVRSTASVSDDPKGKECRQAVAELKKLDFDLLIACVVGWIPSWAVIRTIEFFKDTPILLLGTTGENHSNRLVTTAAQAGTTALRKVLEEMKFRFKHVVCRLGTSFPAREILSFARAARAIRKLRGSLIGVAGYRDMRLYVTGYDPISLKEKFGVEVEHFDLLELFQLMEKMPEKEVKPWLEYLKKNWIFTRKPKVRTLQETIRLYLALRRKIEERNFAALSYSDVDGLKKLIGLSPAGALTLLHDTVKVCSIPEDDTPGALTQLITFYLTGQVAAYLEFYEFTEKGTLMGVPDYVPKEIVDGRITVMPSSFGQFGEGLVNVSRLKTGRVTLVRLDKLGSEYTCHLVTGTGKSPRPWEEAGWAPPAPQLPGLEIDFDCDPEIFLQNVLGQHYIIAYGDFTQEYRDFSHLLAIRFVKEQSR